MSSSPLRALATSVASRCRAAAVLALTLALGLTLAVSVGRAADARADAAVAQPGGDAPVYGVTIDEIAHVEGFVSALAALPERPTTRVYLDVREPASYYARALQQLDPVTTVMGELLDSSDETSISTEAFQSRTESYLQTLGSDVSIWEVGNEVNGNWTGSYPTVAAKLTEAFDDVAAADAQSALTLYANNFGANNCGDGESELTPVQFARQYVPSAVADGLDYVFLSYYPTQCHRREPTSEEVASYMQQLHAVFPNAALGFGEVGLPRAVKHNRKKAQQIMSWAYSLRPQLPYYVGGYFWWYGAEDALRAGAPLAGALQEAFVDERLALEPVVP